MFWLILLGCVVLLLVLAASWRLVLASVRLWFLELAIWFLTWRLFRKR